MVERAAGGLVIPVPANYLAQTAVEGALQRCATPVGYGGCYRLEGVVHQSVVT
jgi:hypothetical protein